MDYSPRTHRSVWVAVRCRKVVVDSPDGRQASLSYPGLLLTGYEGGRKAFDKWVPLGSECSDSDDERVVAALSEAFRWQNREIPP